MTSELFRAQFSKYSFPKLGYIKIPKIKIPDEDYAALNLAVNADSKDYLLALVKRGFAEKLDSGKIPANKKDVYWKQAEFELGEINKLLFTDYFLLVYHIIRFCKTNKILNGAGRGSAASSILLWLMGITMPDPINHKLLFERFISSARTEVKEIDGEIYIASESLPDVDLDSDCARKQELNQFIDSAFPNKTCAIANYGTLQGKVAIKEVCKIFLGYSEEESKQVSDLIEAKFGKVDSITKSLDENEEFQRWVNKSPRNKEAVEIAAKLQGLLKNFSVHASGIIITNDPISDTLPTQLTSGKSDVTSVDMGVAQLFGIKIDNLGLKNLSTINETLNLVGKKMADIDVNDPSIYQFIELKDQFYGVFQAEEGLGKQVLKSIKPTNIEDISVSIALGRPGCMAFIKNYTDFKHNGDRSLVDKWPEKIRHIVEPTGGILIFQESLMKTAKEMAGFTPQEADKLRKCTSKKLTSEMPKWKDKFIKQSVERGFNKDFCEWVWEESFIPSSNYSFALSHAISYSYLTAITCYLKANHPLEYFVSMLKNCKNEQDPIGEISKIQSELHHFGIKLLPPHIILSDLDFKIEGPNIRFGLGDIKGIAAKSMQKLLSFRDSKHSSKFEIFESAEKAKLNIGILSSLIQAGTLDDDLAKHKQSRSRLVLEAQVWRLLTVREKRFALHYAPNYNNDLLSVILAFKDEKLKDDKGKEVLKDSRFETIKRDYERYKKIYLQNKSAEEFACWYYERKLLGFPYSSNLRGIFSKRNSGIAGVADVVKAKQESKHLFVGIVDEIKSGISKGKGTRWFRMTVKDEYESFNVLLFNDKIDNCKEVNGDLPKEEDVVIIEGTRKSDAIFADFVKIQEHKVYTKLSDLKENEATEAEGSKADKKAKS